MTDDMSKTLADLGYAASEIEAEIEDANAYNPIRIAKDADGFKSLADAILAASHGDERDEFFLKAERKLLGAVLGYFHYFYEDDPQYQTLEEVRGLIALGAQETPDGSASALDLIMLGATREVEFSGYADWVESRFDDEAAMRTSAMWWPVKQYKGFKAVCGTAETEAAVLKATCTDLDRLIADDEPEEQ